MIGTMGFWFAGLYQDWLSGADALIIGAAVAAVAPIGDLFESMLKRDLGKKDTGTHLRPPRRHARPPRRRLLHGRRRLLPGHSLGLLSPPTLRPMKKLVILGSTGSIGTQALDVVAASRTLRSWGLQRARLGAAVAQARAAVPGRSPWPSPTPAARASGRWDGHVLVGEEGIRELITSTDPDLVLNAIVGAAGLPPTVVALSAGIDVALANKESLVIGGELVMALAEATGGAPAAGRLRALGATPADRLSRRRERVERLVLTASGGPFRGQEDLTGVTVADALRHPTWKMGGRITIDSATLMNKGFEVIEAHHLFGVPYERIDVVVHPQSLVHSLIHLVDGSALAHLGHPDMRVPISYALHFPERVDVDVPQLDLAAAGELTFEDPIPRPSPACDWRARRARPGAPPHACSTPPMRSR